MSVLLLLDGVADCVGFLLLTSCEELLCNLRESDVGKNVLVGTGLAAEFLLGLFESGLERIGISALNELFRLPASVDES